VKPKKRPKGRSPIALAAITRSGGGKHKDKRRSKKTKQLLSEQQKKDIREAMHWLYEED
jgi:hypothetical protein